MERRGDKILIGGDDKVDLVHIISLDFAKSMARSSARLEVTDRRKKLGRIIGVYCPAAIREIG